VKRLGLLIAAGAIAGCTGAAPSQVEKRAGALSAADFTMVPLSPFGGTNGYVAAINNHGQVVEVATDAAGVGHCYLWEAGTITNLGNLGGGECIATDINENGQIVGYSRVPDNSRRAFLWDHGVMTNLGSIGTGQSYAYDINDNGVIAGDYEGPGQGCFVWENGVTTDLGNLGRAECYVRGINNAGQIAGDSGVPIGPPAFAAYKHPFLYDHGVMTDLGTLGSPGHAEVAGINGSGAIAGSSLMSDGHYHAFRYQGGVMADLGTLPGGLQSTAQSVDEQGRVFMTSTAAGDESRSYSVLWDGAVQDLRPFLPRGSNAAGDLVGTLNDHGAIRRGGEIVDLGGGAFNSSSATYINDSGLVAGAMAWPPGGVGALWVPRTEPPPAATRQWIALAPTGTPPAPREGHVAAYAPASNRMIIVGGQLGFGVPANTIDAWALENANGLGGPPHWTLLGTWDGASSPGSLVGAGGAYDAEHDVLILYGGRNCAVSPCVWPSIPWILENASGVSGTPTWRSLAPTGVQPGPLWDMVTGYDPGSNRLIIYTGQNASGPGNAAFPNKAWALTNANGRGGPPEWIELATAGNKPVPRVLASGGYLASTNMLVVFGGSPSGVGVISDAWILENANGTASQPRWQPGFPQGAPPTAGFAASAVLDDIGPRLIVFGGSSGNLQSNETWVAKNAGWSLMGTVGPAPAPRYIHSAVYDPTSARMIIFGGRQQPGVDSNDAWVLPTADEGAPNGTPCTGADGCKSGFCVDGVCCDGACGGGDTHDCEACAVAAGAPSDGACALLTAATACYTRPAGDLCSSVEATLTCGSGPTCPAPTPWAPDACEPPDDLNLVTLLGGTDAPGGMTVQFDDAWPGTLAVKRAYGCPPPTGFEFLPNTGGLGYYWNVDAQPPISGGMSMELCVRYDQSWFGAESPMEQFIQILHGDSTAQQGDGTCNPIGAAWTYLPRTRVVDTVNNVICSSVSSFSPIALVVPRADSLPVLHLPGPLQAEATGPGGAAVTYLASATDLQDGSLVPGCTPSSGSTFPLGTTTVSCRVTDSSRLTVTATFTVTVADTKGPTIARVPSSPIVAYATGTSGAKVTYAGPTATDAVDGGVAVKCLPASGATFAPGKTTVTCNAADRGGRAAIPATFTVWVQYQAPTDGTFFLLPIRPNGSSIFRVGRPVPVRFKLTGASAVITDLQAKLVATKISSTVQGTSEDTSDETVDDTDLVFKYRALLKWYAYRWKTSNQTQGTYRLEAVLGDGVSHSINVSLKGAK
jgi:probable HAF family extracellular repeat protein